MRNLLILATWLAGQANVGLRTYNGTTAAITLEGTKRVILIPQDWSYSNDPDAAVLLEGVMDHEALGHGRWTDLEARGKAEKDGMIKWVALSASIQNILEDIYIENEAIKAYPGVKANLAATIQILLRRDFFGNPAAFPHAGPSQLLIGGLLNILRGTLIPGQEALFVENIDALNVILPAKLGTVWLDVLEIAQEVQNSKCTQDNILLTIRIMDVLMSAAQSPTTSEKQTQGEPDQDDPDEDAGCASDCQAADGPPEDSQGSTDGDGAPAESKPSDTAKASSSDSQESGEGDARPGESKADGDPQDSQGSEAQQPASCEGESADGVNSDLPDDVILSAREILDSQDDEAFKTELSDVIAVVMGSIASSSGDVMSESKPHGNFSDTAKRVASKVKRISDDLQDALETQTTCERRTLLTGKRINSRVLARTRLGNSRIFTSKVEGIGISTAVSILFDVSGSMLDPLADKVARSDAACGLALGLGDVLDEYDVPFEVNAYSDRYVGLKQFDDDWSAYRKADIGPSILGGTHTGAGMQKALEGLVCRDEERRLLIVVTDGDTSDMELLFSCYAEAKAMDIEIASVMIGPMITSIQALAQKFGFPVKHCNKIDGLGTFAVERILESI